MTFNKHLLEAANSKGFVVTAVEPSQPTTFGTSDAITVHGADLTITFISNVLHDTNYFKIICVKDHLKDKMYLSPRYFTKHISLINQINGETHIAMKEVSK